MTITELSIKRPILIVVAFLAITLIGIFSYLQLKYETFPNMSPGIVSIFITYNGASASVVESTITKKIEDAVSGISNADTVESDSEEGSSLVWVTFKNDTDIDVAAKDIQDKVNRSLDSLPGDASQPSYTKFSTSDAPILQIGVTSRMEPKALNTFLINTLKPQLSKEQGVAQIGLIGAAEREIRVNVDNQKLHAYGLSNAAIANAITDANMDLPTGKVKDRDGQYMVRLNGKLNSLEQLKNLTVKDSLNGQVILSDVADVQDGSEDQSTINRVNGNPSVGIQVYKQSDANQVEVCRLVRGALKKLEADYQSIHLKFVIIDDRSTYTSYSVKGVQEDLLFSILLVALVMLLFLHSFRNATIVMVAIPTSLTTTMIGMWLTGCTMNLITLLAMSLVIGILVDDSIVVLENIHHHLEKGEDQRNAVLNGRNEIGFTALSITLVDVVVFLPLTFISGMLGGFLHQFAVVVVISTMVSLLVSFTVTPMLSFRFSKTEKLSEASFMGRFGLWFEAQYQKLVDSYLTLLESCLRHRARVLLLAGVLFVASLALIPAGFVGAEFMPQSDQGQLTVKIELPSRAKLEQTNQLAKQVEKILWQVPEVNKIFATVGTGTFSVSTATSNSAEITAVLVDPKDRRRITDEVVYEIQSKLDRLPGMTAHVKAASLMDFGGDVNPIEYVVMGANWDQVYQAALKVKRVIAQVPGTNNVQLSTEEAQPEVQVNIDREKMAQLGLTLKDVGTVLQTGLTGDTSTKFRDQDGEEFNIRVMNDLNDRSSTDEIGSQSFVNASGETVQLNQFATLVNGAGPNKLTRRDRNYAITISSQAIGNTAGDIAGTIDKKMSRIQLSAGVICMPSGMLEQQDEAFGSLGLALLAAIIFVYLLMTALYNSFVYPFAVLFSVPLAMIGAVFALGLSGNALDIFAILGIVMLVGLVSKNAILLVDFANRARAEGAGIIESLIDAGRQRIRPILMTTLTMILGMLPLALSHSTGSEFKHGIGWVLIGGLTSSMVMTLIVVPVIYSLIEQFRKSVRASKNSRGSVRG